MNTCTFNQEPGGAVSRLAGQSLALEVQGRLKDKRKELSGRSNRCGAEAGNTLAVERTIRWDVSEVAPLPDGATRVPWIINERAAKMGERPTNTGSLFGPHGPFYLLAFAPVDALKC